MHRLQTLFYLTIVLHASGIIITHLQEQSSDKINFVTCASCWNFYIRILLRCTDPCILNFAASYYGNKAAEEQDVPEVLAPIYRNSLRHVLDDSNF